jgi:predicted ATPase
MSGEVCISSSGQSAFAGRENELAELAAGLDDLCAGRGRLFLVTGEPGIGKSRLAEEVAGKAASRGILVLRARCWDGGGTPAYWSFIQLIRGALGSAEGDALLKRLGAECAPHVMQDVAQLIPELQPSIVASVRPSAHSSQDVEQARFRLFESIATMFKVLAGLRPLMLVVEDLHDADQPSLVMLRFVVRQLKNAPLMVVGNYRDAEVQRSPILSQLLGDLVREGAPVPLLGLNREGAAQMIEERAAAPCSPKLISDIHQATAGNPLFIDGLVRVLAADGTLSSTNRLDLAAFRVPDGVREAIRRWLGVLSDRSSLVIAATIGQQFELRCLQRVTQLPNHHLLDTLREARAVGVVTPVSHDRYRFTHALIRNAMCDELNSADRAEVHLKIGKAIEELYRVDVEVHTAALAHHFREGGESQKAVDYSIRAGEAANAVFAYEQAITHWQAALELMPDGRRDWERRADLLERTAHLLGLTAPEGAEQFKYLR